MSPLLLLLSAFAAVLALAAAWVVWRGVTADATHLGGVHPNRARPEPGAETVEDLIQAGRLIEAIKRVREQTGLGLAEAKDRVDFYRSHGRWPEAASTPPPRPPVQVQNLEELIRAGNMIQAIKLAREQNPGMDLRTAKELVEVLAARMR